MPPRASLASFSVSDPDNEVVCPLTNQDGSQCRKRCFGEKRYRSMQEHIRRAHPEHYIPKLPATEESFQYMINKIPSPPRQHQYQTDPALQQHPQSHGSYQNQSYDSKPPQSLRRGSMLQSASAAAALAQLHNSRPEPEWQADQDPYGDEDNENSYLHNYFAGDGSQDIFNESGQVAGDRDFMAPPLNRTPSVRASSLQPHQRMKPTRPRKSSVTENARRGKHERDRSKEVKRLSGDRKSLSAEPSLFASNKRWEDLLDAAASATEEDSRDLTPIPQSPRSSMPPTQPHVPNQNPFQSYNTSPLQNAVLTQSPGEEDANNNNNNGDDDVGPPPYSQPHMEPFPSVESYDAGGPSQQPYHHHHHHHQSSNESANSNMYTSYQATPQQPQHHQHHPSQSSGANFHIPGDGLSSSPPQHAQLHRTTSFSRSTHYPHALHQAAAQAAAAQQQQHQPPPQQPPTPQQSQHPYSAHHASYSASHGGGGGGGGPPPLHAQHSGMSAPAPAHHHNHAHAHAHLQDASPPTVQHYCAACHRITALNSSYACTECICGICRDCVDVLISMDPSRGAGCPRCQVVGGRFKPFMLDLR